MPTIMVLAGVNGAGKSSLLGTMLREQGGDWFNPDSVADELKQIGVDSSKANADAWEVGKNRLLRAIVDGEDYAFETTLGGNTIPGLLREATEDHEVIIWFCGLESAELHVERVARRVAGGGHHVSADLIRVRYERSRENLISLMGGLTTLRVYDNSACMDEVGSSLKLLLNLHKGVIATPASREELHRTPDWAMPIVQRALQLYPPVWLKLSVLSSASSLTLGECKRPIATSPQTGTRKGVATPVERSTPSPKSRIGASHRKVRPRTLIQTERLRKEAFCFLLLATQGVALPFFQHVAEKRALLDCVIEGYVGVR